MVAVRFSSLGDIVLTTGVLLRYHQEHGTMFTVVTRKAFAPVFDGHPAVQEVIGLDEGELHGPSQAAAFRRIVEKGKDSPLLDLHRNLRSALLAKNWKDAIICYRKMSLERRFFLWSKGRLCRKALLSLNVPQRYAAGLYSREELPAQEELRPRLFLSEEEKNHACQAIAGLRKNFSRVVALHPFATHDLKTWKPAAWLAFAALLRKNSIGCFWIGQGPDLPAEEKECSFVNKTGLRQLFALCGEADAVVTGDSAPMHIADAVNTPVLALFGPTTREWGFFPSGAEDRVMQLDLPCRPCSLHGSGSCPHAHACLEGISPDAALGVLQSMPAIDGMS